jgi:hypothetical protein
MIRAMRVAVISDRRFVTTYGFLALEYGTGSLSRNIGKKLPLLATF